MGKESFTREIKAENVLRAFQRLEELFYEERGNTYLNLGIEKGNFTNLKPDEAREKAYNLLIDNNYGRHYIADYVVLEIAGYQKHGTKLEDTLQENEKLVSKWIIEFDDNSKCVYADTKSEAIKKAHEQSLKKRVNCSIKKGYVVVDRTGRILKDWIGTVKLQTKFTEKKPKDPSYVPIYVFLFYGWVRG